MTEKQHDDQYDQAVDDKYVDSFNAGYILAKHEPDLFKQLEPSLDKDSPIMAGKRQYEAEKAREYFKKFDRNDDKGKDKTKDKNKEDRGISK